MFYSAAHLFQSRLSNRSFYDHALFPCVMFQPEKLVRHDILHQFICKRNLVITVSQENNATFHKQLRKSSGVQQEEKKGFKEVKTLPHRLRAL